MTRGFILERTVGHVMPVDSVGFSLKYGETLGLVSESGSGKTTAGCPPAEAAPVVMSMRRGRVCEAPHQAHGWRSGRGASAVHSAPEGALSPPG